MIQFMATHLRFAISPDVISTEAQLDESLLLNTRTLAYFGLDAMGSKLWQTMQLTNQVDVVIRELANTTGKTIPEIEPFVQSILTGMQRSGLLTLEKILPVEL